MFNKVNYMIHILLHSKHKFLLNIMFYFLIMFVYQLHLNECNVTECMKRSIPIISRPADTEYIMQLEIENMNLKNRIILLERELKFNLDQRYIDQIRSNDTIRVLRENQEHLIEEIRSLKGHITEAQDTYSELVCDNVDLRCEIMEHQQKHIDSQIEKEAAKKKCDEDLDSLREHKNKKSKHDT